MENPYNLTPPNYQEPPRAKTIRRAARAALKGHWFRMALVMLVFLLLTTTRLNVSFNAGYNFDRLIDDYPAMDLASTVEIGPYTFSNRVPLGMSAVDHYRLPFVERMSMLGRAGWNAIPEALQAVIFAAGALTFVLLLFRPVLQLGLYESISSLYRNEHPRVSQLFSKMRFFGKALWLGILETFYIFLWALLLFVPGIIAGFRYAMAFYILRNNPDMRAIDALRLSKRYMDGNKGRLFCLYFSYLGWTLLAAVPMVVIMAVFYMLSASFPQSVPLWLFQVLMWATALIGNMFLSSYQYVGEFEFFKDLEANGYGEPV